MESQIIYKYQLDATDVQKVKMPRASKILTAQPQFGNPCLWAVVDPRNSEVNRIIKIAGTGYDLSNKIMGDYIGTVQIDDGLLIFHIFDYGEE